MDCKDKDRAEETEAETLSKKTVLLIGTTITFFQLLDPIYSISFLLFLIILIFQKNVWQHCIHVRGPRLLPYESDSGCSTAVHGSNATAATHLENTEENGFWPFSHLRITG